LGRIFDLGVREGHIILIWGYAEGYSFDLGVRRLRTPDLEHSFDCPHLLTKFKFRVLKSCLRILLKETSYFDLAYASHLKEAKVWLDGT
jgi:hypothetical protein